MGHNAAFPLLTRLETLPWQLPILKVQVSTKQTIILSYYDLTWVIHAPDVYVLLESRQVLEQIAERQA